MVNSSPQNRKKTNPNKMNITERSTNTGPNIIMQSAEFRTGVIKPVECMNEGWAMIKDRYWLIFGITLVGMLIGGLIPLGIGIGAMFCGIYYVLLRKMNGENFEFGDLFKGFNYFLPGLITSLIVIIPALIGAIIIYGSMMAIFFASMGPSGKIDDSVLIGLIITFFVEAVVFSLFMGCLHALVMFAYPLIVDRGLNGVEAFKLSAKAVWANLSGVVGIILLEFVMGFAAYILTFFIFGLGAYLVMPVMFAGVLVAYRRVFSYEQRFDQPPPPPSYPDAGNYT